MSKTLDLLRLTPEAALREIIGECLVEGVSPSVFSLGVPVEVSGLDTSIELKLDRLNVPVDLWVNTGVVDFRFPRLDLSAEFAKFEPEAVVDFPTNTKKIREVLTNRYGIVFDDNDFVDEDVEYADRGNFVLKTKPTSLRWVGNYPLKVSQRVLELNEAFQTKQLDFYNEPVIGNFKDLFVASVNRVNEAVLYRPILRSELELTDPVVVNDFDIPYNTKMEVRVTTSDLYKGVADFYYNRLNLHTLTVGQRVEVRSISFSETWEAAQRAGDILGVSIGQIDVVSETLPLPAPGQSVDIDIEIREGSRGLVGPLHITFTRAV